jgi:hypothetical protein
MISPAPPPSRPAREDTASAEHHLFDDRRGVQGQHDNFGLGRDAGGGLLELGTTGDQVVGGCAAQVRDVQAAESVEQAGGDGAAHHAEPDHPNRAGGWSVDGVGGFGAGQGDSSWMGRWWVGSRSRSGAVQCAAHGVRQVVPRLLELLHGLRLEDADHVGQIDTEPGQTLRIPSAPPQTVRRWCSR